MLNTEKREPTVDDIINEIKEKSSDGDYIYRGERKPHDDVSSALYREFFNNENFNIEYEDLDLTHIQQEMLQIARKHIGKSSEDFLEDFETVMGGDGTSITSTALEILTELQHYGGKTNLIDFTTDFLIAIFFACTGEPNENGRVILLRKTKDIENMIFLPLNPRHRVIAQKSIFLHPPTGLINVNEGDIVKIPAILKEPFRKYLDKYHNISAETIYNDIHGFIRYQNIHQNIYLHLLMGLTIHRRGINAKSPEERQNEFETAITHYSETIRLKPDFAIAYNNRGEAWLHLQEMEKAAEDLMIAQNMGSDLPYVFRKDYKDGVKEFEKKTGIQVPKHIAVLLGN